MRIGIDFDRVLFDTDAFREHLDEKIPGFNDTYPKNQLYNPEEHAEVLGVDPEKIHETIEECEQFVYPDIEKLEKLESHKLILVSRGDPVFQKEKIEESGVKKYFDEIVIVQSEDKDVVDIDLLVDDSREELENADVPGFHFDREKHSLEDVVEKVEEIDG